MSKNKNCSFCGRKKDEVKMLIAGLNGDICEVCIEQAHGIVQEESNFLNKQEVHAAELVLKTPKEIHTFLNDYVIGQEQAKKVLSVAVYNHYKRIQYAKEEKDQSVELEKSNILLVGETGTGKTLLARTIARFLNVPFTIVDATVLTEAGYVGEDVEGILTKLLQAADYNPKLAERGIIFIDEIDKIARKSDNPSITRDVSGEGVQQAMLKILEGATVNVPPQGGRKHPDQKFIPINTKDILFIAGGAFSGIENHISKRLNAHAIGFKSDASAKENLNFLNQINAVDLKSFGMIPELLGRLPVITHLNPLTEEALLEILTKPKNALIKQYTKMFELDGVELTVKKPALEAIVKRTMDLGLGARGLRSLTEKIFLDFMYDSNQNKSTLTVDSEVVVEKLGKTIQEMKLKKVS